MKQEVVIFEETMRELILQMPPLVDAKGNSYPILYEWGTQAVLNKFLLLPMNVSKYPLIWLVTGKDTDNVVEFSNVRKARFVIATRSEAVDEFNEFQYDTQYKTIIIPIYENFIKLLKRSGITTILNEEIEKELRPNYSVLANDKGLIDTWNALVLDIEIRIIGNRCINTINFS